MFLTRKLGSVVCTSESSSATDKFPGSMQTRRSRVYGEFWLRFGVRVKVRVRGLVRSSPVP